jgi:integrase
MKRIVAEGIYFDGQRYSYRPKNPRTGRRTERRLKARTLTKAVLELHKLRHSAPAETSLAKLAALYLAAHCPDRKGVPRPAAFTRPETTRAAWLVKYFGQFPAADITLARWLEYKIWRQKRIARKHCAGLRAIDQEGTTLSNLLNYGVLLEQIPVNHLHHGRPRFHTRAMVTPSRDRSPASALELHRLAAWLLDDPRRATQSAGWVYLFQCLTGCRVSEMLRCRMDAAIFQPGFVDNQYFWLKRSKKGINPYAMIHDDFADCLAAHRLWHAKTFPKSPWYFPGRNDQPLRANSITKAVGRAAAAFRMPHRTSHGARAFYVTVRLSQGISAGQIAAEIGDVTGAPIIAQSYGGLPPDWRGGEHLAWKPKDVSPAWSRWLPAAIIPLSAKTARP